MSMVDPRFEEEERRSLGDCQGFRDDALAGEIVVGQGEGFPFNEPPMEFRVDSDADMVNPREGRSFDWADKEQAGDPPTA